MAGQRCAEHARATRGTNRAGSVAQAPREEAVVSEGVAKTQLLGELAVAFEQLISTAMQVARRDGDLRPGTWGPREVVAHLAGWEVMATVRIPRIVAGMQPFEEADASRQAVMNEAINATSVALMGEQPLETMCGLLRQAYQRDIAMLGQLDEQFFWPGEYVYDRTKSV